LNTDVKGSSWLEIGGCAWMGNTRLNLHVWYIHLGKLTMREVPGSNPIRDITRLHIRLTGLNYSILYFNGVRKVLRSNQKA